MNPQNQSGGDKSGSNVIDLAKRRASRKGQGKHSFDDYCAPISNIGVEGKAKGDICPCCGKGKLYEGEARKLLQFLASSPVDVRRYKKEVLRCSACGIEFMSNARIDKWDNSARSSIALQKINGMPFYRLSKLQSLYGAPVAESTLWMQCLGLWEDCGSSIYKQLLAEAAECATFYVDDTGARILEVIQDNKDKPENERRACHTTVIRTAIGKDKKLALYITDNKNAGENIAPVFNSRKNKDHYIRMVVDASSQNTPEVDKELLKRIIIANCMAHGRRKFFELLDYYPAECGYFLKEIGSIYKNDGLCKYYSDKKRLKYHKQHSSQHVRNIYAKIKELFDNKLVEPNSELGKAMNYWIRHKSKLKKFLKIKGIKLDNNEAEETLRTMIMQRKNSLFFKTRRSAAVLSGLASIIKTCEINRINAFGYLNWIQGNWKQAQKYPENYLPWDYRAYMNNTELIAA